MRDDAVIQRKSFRDIDLEDPFFDTLKEAYGEFEAWFRKKANEKALVVYDDERGLQGFVYLKKEFGPITDIVPPLNVSTVLKVGTFKVEAHGTRLGERFVKKVFDYALDQELKHIYVTVFSDHKNLIERLKTYGFSRYGVKKGLNGQEEVYVKDFAKLQGDIRLDYPVINALEKNKWLLAIYPKFHTRLFPDSILKTEDGRIVEDLTHTNSIHKVYVGWANGLGDIKPGDILVMYRTAEDGKSAEFSSVASSLCVVEEIRPRRSFPDASAFITYCQRHSVFTTNELLNWYRKQGTNEVYAIKMTYNVALPKRPNRRALADEVGLDRADRWALLKLNNAQFEKLLEKGRVHAGLIIHQAGVR